MYSINLTSSQTEEPTRNIITFSSKKNQSTLELRTCVYIIFSKRSSLWKVNCGPYINLIIELYYAVLKRGDLMNRGVTTTPPIVFSVQ